MTTSLKYAFADPRIEVIHMIHSFVAMFIYLGILLSPQVAPEPGLVTVAQEGRTTVTKGSGKLAVIVKIGTRKPRIPPKGEQQEFSEASLCEGDIDFCSIVDSMEIIVSGHRIEVPRCVFCDLGDIHYAQLTIGKQKSILTLDGGDASTSYVVKIEFDQKMVYRRTVAPGEFPDQLFEESNYYEPVLGH